MSRGAAISIDNDKNQFSQHARISLLHWFSWLTVTAVLLVLHRQDMEPAFPQNEIVARYIRATGAVTLALCPLYALAICGAGLGLSRWLRNRRDFPCAPGHWLLVCLGTFLSAHELNNAVFEPGIWALFSSNPEFIYDHVLLGELLNALTLGLTIVVTLIAAWKLSAGRTWRAVILLGTAAAAMFLFSDLRLALYQSFTEVEMWLEDIARLLLLIAGLLVLVISIVECSRRVNRDLVHWLGVATTVACVLESLVNQYGLKYL